MVRTGLQIAALALLVSSSAAALAQNQTVPRVDPSAPPQPQALPQPQPSAALVSAQLAYRQLGVALDMLQKENLGGAVAVQQKMNAINGCMAGDPNVLKDCIAAAVQSGQ